MKKEKIIFTILFILGIISLFFSLGLFFLLPHTFSEAISYYISLAPIIRNYYCVTLLISGLLGILSIGIFLPYLKKNRPNLIIFLMLAVTIVFGLLIYPLVEMFYQTRTGVIQENVALYRQALTVFSIYLSLHTSAGIYSGYRLIVKEPTKKHVIGLCLFLALITGPLCIMSYAKYYDNEEVHLTENLKYQFVGVNGSGSLEVISNDIQIQKVFPSFINTLSYEVLNNGNLKNGEQVAITVTYDTELAKALHLDVVDAVETMEVSGLREFYTNYASIPSKIVEEAGIVANDYVHLKLSEVLPGKETQVSKVAEYYVMDSDQTMDSVHALVYLYKISYTHQGETYYYYRACHVNHVHSDALKDLEILEAVIDASTYRSSLCQSEQSDKTSTEAKAHLYAALMNQYDVVEEVGVSVN